jgi:hypothetical protein
MSHAKISGLTILQPSIIAVVNVLAVLGDGTKYGTDYEKYRILSLVRIGEIVLFKGYDNEETQTSGKIFGIAYTRYSLLFPADMYLLLLVLEAPNHTVTQNSASRGQQ